METEKREQFNAQGNNQGNPRRRRNRHRRGGRPDRKPDGVAQGDKPQGGQNAQKQVHAQNGQQQNKPQPQPQNKGKAKVAPQVQSPVQTDNFRRQKPPKKQENAKKKKGGEQEYGKDTYVYALDGNLYINLTNKCCNGCEFCVRNERSTYYGHSLWLRHGDPTAQQVISAIEAQGDLTAFQEFVFCGFGEPTYRMEELRAVCDYLKQKGLKTRLNTNGQGNLVNKRDILPDLKGRVDMINVSLNAPDAESYKKLCRPMFGEAGFAGMIDFAKTAKRMGIPCRFSVVDCIGEDNLAACKKLSQDTNVPLYIRSYITDSGE